MKDSPSPYEYFTQRELMCRCGCGRQEMDRHFMRKIVAMRKKAGFPFSVTSAFRCADHNSRVSSTGRTGPHTTGRAIDVSVRGSQAHRLIKLACDYGLTGIGVSQKGNNRFLHFDDLGSRRLDAPKWQRARPSIWSY